MKARAWLVRLYPRAWRARYGEEFEALLEECLRSPLDVLDILLGALDAHLDFSQASNWRLMNMINKLRTSILIVFSAYVGFILGGLSFYGLVDDSPAAALMRTNTALSAAWTTVEAGSIATLLAIAAGGLPLAWVITRRVLGSPRKDLRLLLVPLAAFVALVLYFLFMLAIYAGWLSLPGVASSVSPDNFPLGNRLLLGGFMLLFALAAAAKMAAVWRVLTHADASESEMRLPGRPSPVQLYEFAYPMAAIATLGMSLMLVATLAFGWLAYRSLPGWFSSNQGLLLTNTTFSYAVTVAVMVLSTGAAFFGLARGYGFRKPGLA